MEVTAMALRQHLTHHRDRSPVTKILSCDQAEIQRSKDGMAGTPCVHRLAHRKPDAKGSAA